MYLVKKKLYIFYIVYNITKVHFNEKYLILLRMISRYVINLTRILNILWIMGNYRM